MVPENLAKGLSFKSQAEELSEKLDIEYDKRETPPEKLDLWLICKEIERVFKQASKRLESKYCDEHKDVKFEMGDFLYFIGDRKTNRFATDQIFSLLGFTDEQIEVLPKTPTFRKTAIMRLMEKVKKELFWEDHRDVIEIKAVPKYLLKKGSGRESG